MGHRNKFQRHAVNPRRKVAVDSLTASRITNTRITNDEERAHGRADKCTT